MTDAFPDPRNGMPPNAPAWLREYVQEAVDWVRDIARTTPVAILVAPGIIPLLPPQLQPPQDRL